MRIKLLYIIFFTSISLLYPQSISKSAGTSSNLFLRSGISAKTSGLAETYTAISNDENALFYNPAGLANISKGAVGFNHTQWFEDIRIDNVIVGYNFHKKLGIGLSVSHMWMPAITGKDQFGNVTNDINVSSSIINLGLGYKVHPSLFIGIGVKYFRDDLAGYATNGLAVDAGMYMHTFIRGLTFGIAVQNMGGDVVYDQVQERIPQVYRTGLSYYSYNSGIRIAVDAVKALDNEIVLGTAFEYTLLKTFTLRFGNQFQQSQVFKPGYGAAFNINQQYIVDYTYFAQEGFGNTHRIGFTFRFNLPEEKSKTIYSKYIVRSTAPNSLYKLDKGDKLIINWSKVTGASYNIYAKVSKTGTWKKLNTSLLRENSFEFKKLTSESNIYFCVTSVVNNVESGFSRELELNAE
jgi:hypothetical protein